MNSVYRWEFQVPAAAVDANGHVNNVEYVRWMQEAAVLHSEEQWTILETSRRPTWMGAITPD